MTDFTSILRFDGIKFFPFPQKSIFTGGLKFVIIFISIFIVHS